MMRRREGFADERFSADTQESHDKAVPVCWFCRLWPFIAAYLTITVVDWMRYGGTPIKVSIQPGDLKTWLPEV